MTCKECIHFDVCENLYEIHGDGLSGESHVCDYFADRSRFVELPCKVGQKIFRIKNGKIQEGVATAFFYGKEFHIVNCKFSKTDTGIPFYRFGKTVFLTKEEAEQALKERETK